MADLNRGLRARVAGLRGVDTTQRVEPDVGGSAGLICVNAAGDTSVDRRGLAD